MALRKCPKCELNYIKDDEKYCNICKRDMKREADETDDLQNLCIECGENKALRGQDVCGYCLAEKRRREKLEKLMDNPSMLDMEMEQLDEIEVPSSSDIPTDDLNDIHKEFGDEDENDAEADGDEEED